jgi:hypothetical protein
MGVKQGDAMAAVLFILVMQAMAETLTPLWEEASIVSPEFHFHKETKACYGKMKGQNVKTKGTTFALFLSLYVDDGSFMFETKEDMKKGATVLYHHMKRFGLLMHIGKDGGKSKTEALYIAPPGSSATDADRSKIIVDHTDQGYVTFNQKFTYLGSIITEDLDDGAEIRARIGKANGILHSLNNLWRSKGLSLNMKKQFFIATIVNILLWGCESLTLRAADLKKMDVFLHKGIRHVLNISRWRQATERLRNSDLRKRLDNIATIQETIEERRLDWLGNVARQPDTNLPKRLLTAWIANPRNSCGQKLTLRDSNAAAINRMLVYNEILTSPSNECPSKTWIPLAKERNSWSTLIYKRRNDRIKQKNLEDNCARRAARQAEQTPDEASFQDPNSPSQSSPLSRTPSSPFSQTHSSPFSQTPSSPLSQTHSSPFSQTPSSPLSRDQSSQLPSFNSLPPLCALPPSTCARLASYMTDDIASRTLL